LAWLSIHLKTYQNLAFEQSHNIFCLKAKQKIMKKNMGNADRIIRVLIAAILAILFFTNTVSGTLGIVLLIVAGVFVLTSLVGVCPLYMPFGLKTCSTKKE